MTRQDQLARNLAAAALSGAWSAPAMTRRLVQALGRKERWLRTLARELAAAYGAGAPRPAPATVEAHIRAHAGYQSTYPAPTAPYRFFWVADTMTPALGMPATWNVPALTSTGALAEWLKIDSAELDWFADYQGRLYRAVSAPLQHYTYRWLLSRRRRARLLEVPKARLKDIQRRLLHEILDRIPPHHAAHGYRAGRSIVTHVTPHAGRAVVLHLDLRQFFPSISMARVGAVFRTAGYPRTVARLLTALCTHAVPEAVLHERPAAARPLDPDTRQLLLHRHLPQGAPTSPALANLCAYRLDCRLAGLSRAVGARYTRYADDLVFSGDDDFERGLRRFHVHVCRIVLEEGFEVNTRKSHFMRQGVRQQVAGVVLNVRPNLPRAEYDGLKAILTNCIRHGPHSQDRDGRADFRGYVAGRIAYLAMIHPARGARLRALFERIAWDAVSK